MALDLLDPGTPGDNDSGTSLPDAAAIINRAIKFTDRQSVLSGHARGLRGKLKFALAGNSLAGYGAGNGANAYFAMAMMLHHSADVIVDTRGYYENVTAAERGSGVDYPRLSADVRGMNFAAGGRTIDQLLNVQLPYILEAIAAGAMHPALLLDPWQNDRFPTLAAAKTAVTKVKQFCDALAPYNILIALMGPAPQDDLLAGTQNAAGKHYIERAMANYASAYGSMAFVPIIDLLATGDPTEEANGLMQWVGQRGGVGGGTNDRIHYAPYGSRLVAPRFANDVLRRWAQPYPRPTFDSTDFDQTINPLGNYLGTQGRLIGGGGNITDLSKAVGQRTTTSANVPAGLELIYDASKGFTITPSLTGLANRPLSLTFAGTATAVTGWAVRFTSSKKLDPQLMEIWGEAWWVGARNVAGVSVGDGRLGLTGDDIIIPFPGIGTGGPALDYVMPGELNEHLVFHSMTPFRLANQFNRAIRYDVSGFVVPGLAVSARLDIGMQGIFGTSIGL